MSLRPEPPSVAPTWVNLLDSPVQTHIHLVGIGGTGLSPIARVLIARGFRVSGSDQRSSAATDELTELGATIAIGHRAENIVGADLVLISSAVPADNPEVQAAHAAGCPVVKREQFLGPLMAGQTALCVAGSHGKTTTTAMIATLLDIAGAEPGFIVGSPILGLGTAARAGRPGGPFVVEADEYDHMFLGLTPQIAVITNVDWDHVDCYPNPEDYQNAFVQFASLVPADGTVIYCADDPGAASLHAKAPTGQATWVSYGLGAGCTWRAAALDTNPEGGTDFEVWREDRLQGRLSLRVSGEHNVRNALAAVATVAASGRSVFTERRENLKFSRIFIGTEKRLETLGVSYGIIVLVDYAHHPTEVRATLSAARQRFPRRALWVLFQPHTYSRTRALLNDFCESFENAEHVLVTDIYAARERDTLGVAAQDVVQTLASHPDARYTGSLDSAVKLLLAELRPNDVLITLGAGDGYQVAERVLAALRQREASEVMPRAVSPQEELATAIAQTTGLAVRRDEPLSSHTTLRIGGPADLFVVVNSQEDLATLVRLAQQHGVPFLLLGGGSNVLVSDRGVRGLVVANACRTIERHDGHVVWAESGVNLAGLARQAMRWGLSGLEWCVSVPGTVGGAIVGNAGAHGGAIADNLLRATLLTQDGALAEWPAVRMRYGYRTSALKAMIRSGEPAPLILAAAFQLGEADPSAMEAQAAGFLGHRRATQPVEPSAGSIFLNPPGDYAGRILETLDFKGHRRGGAGFSAMHANFIVNYGGATADDVVGLIDEARQAAWRANRVMLVPEIVFTGDWPQSPPYRPLLGD
jgi:UDP-N-acetylmuramate--alanine ligase